MNRWRVAAFTAVASTFFVQGAFVWNDAGSHKGSTVPLSPVARDGQHIFRSRGCQSCHQLYGMGGFLGPDLTNAAQRVPPARFAQLLDRGASTMPAFHLSATDIRAVAAYLAAVDATGQGTPVAPDGESGPLFGAALAHYQQSNQAPPPAVARGAAIVATRQCNTCHLSFGVNSITRAPDLSLAFAFLGDSSVRDVLRRGRGAMPAQHLTPNESDDVVALLRWIGEHRDDVAPRVQPHTDAPWLAYPPRSAPTNIAAAPRIPAPALP